MTGSAVFFIESVILYESITAILLLAGISFYQSPTDRSFTYSVPSTIVAMLLLLAMLELGIVKAHWFEEIQKFLLQHILLFLIPVALSFVGVLHLLQDTWLRLLVIIIVSSTVTFVVTAKTIDRMIGKENKHVRSDTVD